MNILMFIIGTILGSFYNVVGYRLPKKESIIYPPSHCPNCNHKLKFYELIPIISYIVQKGKCRNCKKRISKFYPIFEFTTGLLFMLSYMSFGLDKYLIIVLAYLSLLIIITVSDYEYMIIPDEVLIFFSVLLFIEISCMYGISKGISSIINGIISFIFMFILKKIGDYIFKKESMGGGDIKLMFVNGMVLTYQIAILSVFVGSFVGLPIALLQLKNKSEHIIAFGPFIAIGSIILLLMHIDLNTIISIYNS